MPRMTKDICSHNDQSFFIYYCVKLYIIAKKYIRFFKLNKYVEFLPYQKDINKFYSSLDCLICASRYEAFGRAVAEAMLCKKPVIVGSNIGAADIIKDGANGFIYNADYNFAYNLAKKMEVVIKSQTQLSSIVDRAHEISKNLSWDNFAKKVFSELYD